MVASGSAARATGNAAADSNARHHHDLYDNKRDHSTKSAEMNEAYELGEEGTHALRAPASPQFPDKLGGLCTGRLVHKFVQVVHNECFN